MKSAQKTPTLFDLKDFNKKMCKALQLTELLNLFYQTTQLASLINFGKLCFNPVYNVTKFSSSNNLWSVHSFAFKFKSAICCKFKLNNKETFVFSKRVLNGK